MPTISPGSVFIKCQVSLPCCYSYFFFFPRGLGVKWLLLLEKKWHFSLTNEPYHDRSFLLGKMIHGLLGHNEVDVTGLQCLQTQTVWPLKQRIASQTLNFVSPWHCLFIEEWTSVWPVAAVTVISLLRLLVDMCFSNGFVLNSGGQHSLCLNPQPILLTELCLHGHTVLNLELWRCWWKSYMGTSTDGRFSRFPHLFLYSIEPLKMP